MAIVVLTAEAKEDFADLDGAERKIVAKGLIKLQDEPEKRGEPLGARGGGNLTGLRKLVVGKKQYRIVYRVEPDGTVCVVWVIGSRVDAVVYDVAESRLRLYADRTRMADQLQELIEQTRAAGEFARRLDNS